MFDQIIDEIMIHVSFRFRFMIMVLIFFGSGKQKHHVSTSRKLPQTVEAVIFSHPETWQG